MKLIKITAIWCISCIYMNELLKDIQYEYETLDFDYDRNKKEIEKYNIGKTLPVYILLDENDKEINRLIGEKSKKQMIEFLKGNK
ncbi:MAG TPA: thioredoxin family protein [Mollicutes bacterium]|nr:thioredoxin family protein [Mollicutes bacterium]